MPVTKPNAIIAVTLGTGNRLKFELMIILEVYGVIFGKSVTCSLPRYHDAVHYRADDETSRPSRYAVSADDDGRPSLTRIGG